MTGEKARKDVFGIITDQILERLEEGVIPWRCPWNEAGPARNFVSGRPYSGVNTFLLAMRLKKSAYWLTARQIKERGGRILKGAKSSRVVFWKELNPQNAGDTPRTDDAEKRFVLRYYRIFSADDIQGIETGEERARHLEFEPVDACERVLEFPECPEIKHGGDRAFYSLLGDYIQMPDKEVFHSVDAYYGVLFHKLTHSTGAARRLNRNGFDVGEALHARDKKTHSFEELIAEMGSSFLSGITGINNDLDNAAAYIDGWKRFLTDNPRAVVLAASAAQKAVNFILGEASIFAPNT